MRSVFVTGTDTSVGKTAVTAALLAWMRTKRVDAVPMKPVQTGWPEADDIAWALQEAGLIPFEDERAFMNPYRFALPASPHLAARDAGKTIDLETIRKAYEALAKKHEVVIVEGAGGLLVPLNDKDLMIDIPKLLRLPVLIVARPTLGTLNHTLLSVRELLRNDLHVVGIILSEKAPGSWGQIEEDNLRTLRKATGLPVLRMPHLRTGKAGALADQFQSLDNVFSGLSNHWKHS